MAASETQERWFARVVETLGALDGVTAEARADGSVALALTYDGAAADAVLTPPGPAAGYAVLKDQYAGLRDTLTGLGIEEGAPWTPPPPPAANPRGGRAPTPQMRAARAEQRKAHDAWQDALRTIRKAEEALEVEYEIAQMRDYS